MSAPMALKSGACQGHWSEALGPFYHMVLGIHTVFLRSLDNNSESKVGQGGKRCLSLTF